MIFFQNLICFYVLYNVRHKISNICIMMQTLFCADLFSRLCWSNYWWIMWFLCGFEYIAISPQGIYRDSNWILCCRQGNVRKESGVFSATLWQPWPRFGVWFSDCFWTVWHAWTSITSHNCSGISVISRQINLGEQPIKCQQVHRQWPPLHYLVATEINISMVWNIFSQYFDTNRLI